MNYNFNIARGGHFEFCQRKRSSAQGKPWDFLQVLKEDKLVVYRFKSLYVSQILMTIDLLPIKHQTAAILDLIINETLKSIKNQVEMRYYIKIYVK